MKNIKKCADQLNQKFDVVSNLLTKFRDMQSSDVDSSRLISAEIFRQELETIIKILGDGPDDYLCEIVPKDQFQKIISMSEIATVEFEGLFGQIVSCSRFPLENPFLIVYTVSIEEAVNFSL